MTLIILKKIPVVKAQTIRVVFTLALTSCWAFKQFDVNNAFINGVLEEDACMY